MHRISAANTLSASGWAISPANLCATSAASREQHPSGGKSLPGYTAPLRADPWLHRPGYWSARSAFPTALSQADEWFLQGTEPQPPAAHLAEGLAHIRTPVSGEVIALDPDIPPAHQRVVFARDSTSADQRWVLNGQEIGPVTGPLLWEPVPGQHTLSLVDHERPAPRYGELRGASGAHEGRLAAVSEAINRYRASRVQSGMCLSCSSQTVASLSLGAR